MKPLLGEVAASERRQVTRQAVAVAAATSLYGLGYGAVAVANGLTVVQTCASSLLLFSGGSQFSLVGVIGAGGRTAAAVSASTLLGLRNVLYGVQVASMLRPTGLRRWLAAQVTVDEPTAVALAQTSPDDQARGFWYTGALTYLGWNITTFMGAILGNALGDPRSYGLDAAASAAFLALLWPRLQTGHVIAVALTAVTVAGALVPFVAVGVPVVAAAAVAIAAAALTTGRGM